MMTLQYKICVQCIKTAHTTQHQKTKQLDQKMGRKMYSYFSKEEMQMSMGT